MIDFKRLTRKILGFSTPDEQADSGSSETEKPPKRKESTRDTVESILFAFILAFLFRTFEAEAFVIPTGSMAPTLYGRHKETDCTECGFHITVGASDEVERGTTVLGEDAQVRSAICPNCGFENPQIKDELAFNGDRILVNKYPYEFGEPDRFDVFVFKYPIEPKTNYIKRLVGLPGETLRIRGGNVFRVVEGDEQILRKSPYKQRRLEIPVYDDNHPPRQLLAAGWPERWASMKSGQIGKLGQWSDTANGWESDRELRQYRIGSENTHLEWLRYRHYFADPDEWFAVTNDYSVHPQASLIVDLCGYNAYTGNPIRGMGAPTTINTVDLGSYWIRDLAVSFTADIETVAQDAEIVIELCEGTSWYRCVLEPATGTARLLEVNSQLGERVTEIATAQTEVDSPGQYELHFANMDDRLLLWVDGKLVDFGSAAELDVSEATGNPLPTANDLTPVGIAARGTAMTISELKLSRDVYYRADFPNTSKAGFEGRLKDAVYDPDQWAQVYLDGWQEYDEVEFDIPEGHYFALGDNSPRSLDSRLWTGQKTVPRKFLVGKAFYIYWPHGVPFLNEGQGFTVVNHRRRDGNRVKRDADYPQYTFPFYPQFSRMRRIY